MIIRNIISFKLICILSVICEENFNKQKPTYTVDPDGDIPVVEGHGGNYDIAVEDEVLILTRDNFQHVVSSRDLILVEFYAPWCGHCKALEPEYAAAAEELKESGIQIGKVDATKEVELAKEHLIEGYPTLKLFRKNGDVEDYEGGRTKKDIVTFMKQRADPNYKPPPSSVIVLTNSNFTKTVKSTPLILVEFYAPWCKHCKRLEPEYEAAAQELKQHDIVLAKVDGVAEKELADEYGINGYPALIIFRKGRKFEYTGPREKNGIVSHMKEEAKLPSWEIQNVLEAQNNLARTEATVFGYFEEKNDMYEEYIGAANSLRGKFGILHTFKPEVAEKFKLKKNSVNVILPQIYHSKYEEKQYAFEKATATYKDIAVWIVTKTRPLVGQRTKANQDIKYTNRPLVVIYYDVNYSHQYVKDTQYVRNKILPIAAKFQDFIFAISNEEEFADEIKSVGLEDSGEDVNVCIFDGNHKYPMKPDDDFDTEVLEEFIQKFKKGKVKPFLKSQPVPKKNDGPVKVVVAKNFADIVTESDKDVMIEFYAPWCGHCKSLEPIYKKVAKHMAKKNPNVILAKMDATANDVLPMFKVEGFPTIYYLKAGEKDDPIPYSGERTFEKLTDFIKLKSSIFGTDKDEL